MATETANEAARRAARGIACALLVVVSLGACSTTSRLEATGAEVAPPQGFVEFCRRHVTARECGAAATEMLRTVNAQVFRSVRFVPDVEQYGVAEHWAYPDAGAGDCEDHALEKFRRLLDAGYPRAMLRLATASTPAGYHAVLLADDASGQTWVLDNGTAEPLHLNAVLAWYGWRFDRVQIPGTARWAVPALRERS